MDRGQKRRVDQLFFRGVTGIFLFVSACAGNGIPGWAVWHSRTEALPPNPGLLEGSLILKDRQLVYTQNGAEWKTEKEWFVSDFLLDDIDRDGWTEVLMDVWVKGQYGDHHPVWETPQESVYTQRLFVFDIREDHLEPQWMSSEMKPNYKSWDIEDHVIILTDPSGEQSCWKWEGRGFTRIATEAERQ